MIFATMAIVASETRFFAAQTTFSRRTSIDERAKKIPDSLRYRGFGRNDNGFRILLI